MADIVQWRGGPTEKVSTYVGLSKEIIVDTTKWVMLLQDGITPGGIELGARGENPDHRWLETAIQFQHPDGTWGDLVDLSSEASVAQIAALLAAGDIQVARIVTEGDTQELQVIDQGTASIVLVDAAGDTQINLINAAGAAQVTEINSAGDTQVTAVDDKGVAVIALVDAETVAHVGLVTAEGITQFALVTAEGTAKVSAVASEGTTQIATVTAQGDTDAARVVTEGNTQVARVTAEGDTQVAAVQAAAGTDEIVLDITALQDGKVNKTDSVTLTGDVTGTADFSAGDASLDVNVGAIQGVTVSGVAPTDKQVLGYDADTGVLTFVTAASLPILVAPGFSGVSTGIEVSDVSITITNFNSTATYELTVTGGSAVLSGSVITWTLPDTVTETTHTLTVNVTQEGYLPAQATYDVLVTVILFVGDTDIIFSDIVADWPIGQEGPGFVYTDGENQDAIDSDFYKASVEMITVNPVDILSVDHADGSYTITELLTIGDTILSLVAGTVTTHIVGAVTDYMISGLSPVISGTSECIFKVDMKLASGAEDEEFAVNSKGFEPAIYDGSGAIQSITGVGFSPGLVWIKARDAAFYHLLFDNVRGPGKYIRSNDTTTEDTDVNTLTSFDSDGFSLGTGSASNNAAYSFVSWCWRADKVGFTENAAFDPQTEMYSLESGLSIIKYVGTGVTGRKLKHSQSTPIKFLLVKSLLTTDNWFAGHASLGFEKYIMLNERNVASDASTSGWNNMAPTDTDITLGSAAQVNGVDDDFICYAFAEVPGISSFGSYEGNSNSDGPTIADIGFRPSFVLIKSINIVGSWVILGDKRVAGTKDGSLYPDLDSTENLGYDFITFTDTGFKINIIDSYVNAIGTYIYMAFSNAGDIDLSAFKDIIPASAEYTAPAMTKTFKPVLYTGNGTTQSITGLGFSPGLTWIKSRTTPKSNCLFDIVRGATKYIVTDTTAPQGADVNFLTSFDTDGFTLGAQSAGNAGVESFVSWCWKADKIGFTENSASDPQTEMYSLESGLSIIQYLGTSVAGLELKHSLTSKPSFVVTKNIDSVGGWLVWHTAILSTQFLRLEDSTAIATSATPWNDTDADSDTITVGSNTVGNRYISYVFAEIAGVNSFGSYNGNGSATGPTIICGFRPALVICKRIDDTGNWNMFDNLRVSGNADGRLSANLLDVEVTGYDHIGITDTGFTINTASGNINILNGNYIYMAFAEGTSVPSELKQLSDDTILPDNTRQLATGAELDTGESVKDAIIHTWKDV